MCAMCIPGALRGQRRWLRATMCILGTKPMSPEGIASVLRHYLPSPIIKINHQAHRQVGFYLGYKEECFEKTLGNGFKENCNSWTTQEKLSKAK